MRTKGVAAGILLFLVSCILARADEAATVEALISRTYAAMTRAGNIDGPELQRDARILGRLLEQYGYTKGTQVMQGDIDLIWKAFMFTRQCILGGMTQELELSKPEEAIGLYRKTFTPEERKALDYELSAAKFTTADQKRAQILTAAGLRTDAYVVESNRGSEERVLRPLGQFTARPSDSLPPAREENESTKWDQKAIAEYAGISGIVLETSFTEPKQYFLVQVANNLPLKTLKSAKEFSTVPVHTDLKILFAVPINGGVLVKCLGKTAYFTVPLTDSMSEMGGYPGTRLDLSSLDFPLLFLGKKWMHAPGATCVIQITKERIETFGCSVTEGDPTPGKTRM